MVPTTPVTPPESEWGEDDSINIIKSSKYFRQHISVSSQPEFVTLIERMMRLMRVRKFTGEIRIVVNMGGIRTMYTEEELK